MPDVSLLLSGPNTVPGIDVLHKYLINEEEGSQICLDPNISSIIYQLC